jgi:hypothetical protein
MIKGHWEPRTEEEWQLMEDLHVVTRHAHNEGVERERIGALLAFMASAAVDPEGDTESERSQSKPNTETLADKLDREREGQGNQGKPKKTPCKKHDEWQSMCDYCRGMFNGGYDGEQVFCPSCDSPIDGYMAGMGLKPLEMKPCGCNLWEELDETHVKAWWGEYKDKL